MNKIDLVKDTINNEDIDNLISWLKTYPSLTKGKKTIEFEKKWSEWLGCKIFSICKLGVFRKPYYDLLFKNIKFT